MESSSSASARRQPSAVEFGIGLLAARSFPERKLRERLARRYEPAEVDAAIARLKELGMVDDAAWAERFAVDRFQRAGRGRHRIVRELQAKGIDAATASEAVSRVVCDAAGMEREQAEALVARLARRPGARVASGHGDGQDPDAGMPSVSGDGPLTEKARASAYRRLIARGYPASLVRELLDADR